MLKLAFFATFEAQNCKKFDFRKNFRNFFNVVGGGPNFSCCLGGTSVGYGHRTTGLSPLVWLSGVPWDPCPGGVRLSPL